MKFGGTSVADADAMSKMCDIVQSRVSKHPVVVLSACAGVTNTLISIARLAASGKDENAQQLFRDGIIQRHYAIIQGLVSGLREQDLLIRDLSLYFDELQHLMYGLSITGDLSARVIDFFASYGERMSTAIAVVAMNERGIPAALADSRRCIVTNSDFGKAEPDMEETQARTTASIQPLVDKNKVPVLQGFIASNERGITTTLGRGGSDYTAAIVGAVMNADSIEIWTDVDGILTADPHLVPGAFRITELSFQEASELSYFGAKVLHPSTLLPAIEKNIPVFIYNTLNPANSGTAIKSRTPKSHACVKSISYKRGVTVLNLTSTRMLGNYGFMKKLFDIFNKHQTSVDLITTSEVSVSLSIDESPDISALIEELERYGNVTVDHDKAIICIVGENIKQERGLAARIFGRLADIQVDMISQGASDINLTFVVDEAHVPAVVSELHKEFFSAASNTGIFK
jgi:aspartate kinase